MMINEEAVCNDIDKVISDWLTFTPEEIQATYKWLENEMETYQEKIRRMTGREIEQRQMTCQMCPSMFEDVCSACKGEKETTEWVYIDCSHLVESDECRDWGCLCEVVRDGDSLCLHRASQIVTEPYTPASYAIHCCDECANDLVSQGYRRAA